MDKLAAALATASGMLLVLIWQQFQQIVPMGGDITSIATMVIVVVGLTVYMQSHSSR